VPLQSGYIFSAEVFGWVQKLGMEPRSRGQYFLSVLMFGIRDAVSVNGLFSFSQDITSARLEIAKHSVFPVELVLGGETFGTGAGTPPILPVPIEMRPLKRSFLVTATRRWYLRYPLLKPVLNAGLRNATFQKRFVLSVNSTT